MTLKLVSMLGELETVARQIRLGIWGVRVGLPSSSHASEELRAIVSRVLDWELLIGRALAELEGREYQAPTEIEEACLGAARTVN